MSDERPDFTWDEFSKRAGSGPAPSDDARFVPCYRHRDRTTGITCQRCDKPICGECMRPASVGFQCPDCVGPSSSAGGGAPRRGPRRTPGPLAGVLGGRGPVSTTVALMVITGAVAIIDLVSRGAASWFLAFSDPLIAQGQLWRLVTGIFLAGGLLQLLINLLFIWFVGTSVEAEIGRWRMLGVLVVSSLGASAALMLLANVRLMPMQYAVILGLLAAVAAVKLVRGEDIRGDLILLGLMVVWSLAMGSVGWIAQVGAILAGGAAGMVLAKARDSRAETLGLVAVGLVCVVGALAPALLG
ncbi:rhomboid family intramembrane serine protease [Mariniluteicoccus flavus]